MSENISTRLLTVLTGSDITIAERRKCSGTRSEDEGSQTAAREVVSVNGELPKGNKEDL
jgi:hypothetical protein